MLAKLVALLPALLVSEDALAEASLAREVALAEYELAAFVKDV